ncbi:lignin-forming anionic peroxidase-like [Impatiens glandulifera]|uniref:lignin-forming anionic peroxidase-like n=1 Tax=Impatiens glandulifera TaxID=253017 RepID=UPI001FB098F0|nr:lignin-forming anionic peroxidase-like [Impatiens glandulifera]
MHIQIHRELLEKLILQMSNEGLVNNQFIELQSRKEPNSPEFVIQTVVTYCSAVKNLFFLLSNELNQPEVDFARVELNANDLYERSNSCAQALLEAKREFTKLRTQFETLVKKHYVLMLITPKLKNIDKLYEPFRDFNEGGSHLKRKTCPNVANAVGKSIAKAISRERRMAASLIRLHFHDCFVQGCDASILLDENASPTSERNALQNLNSARGYEVIDAAKAKVEKICPGVVSCADILALAARDASVAVGGPSWKVKLGRRDSTTASLTLAERDLPLFTSTLDEHITNFANKGLNARDLVALSGSHTIGQAQCVTFRDRIYSNNSNIIDTSFARIRQRNCPRSGDTGSTNLAPLDFVTPNTFDSLYFKNLIEKKGLLQSDQVLFSGGSTDNIVVQYNKNPLKFKSDFASAMVKMGNIEPLVGEDGIIRRVCSSLD